MKRAKMGAFAACVGAIAAAALPTAGGAQGTPACSAADRGLAGAMIDTQGAAGSSFSRLVIINTSNRTCRLRGYSHRARWIANNGRPFAAHLRHLAGTVRTVTLRPGDAADVTVRTSNVPGTDRPCREARYLQIAPPGKTARFRVYFGAAPCRGDIDVGPIRDPSSVDRPPA